MDAPAAQAVPPLGLVDKSRLLLAAGVAIVLLTVVGWSMAAPDDPEMGVLLIGRWGRMLGVWPVLIVITVIAAVIGTVLAPRRLAEAGVFAAATGLAGLALRGGSMQDVLGYLASPTVAIRRWVMTQMALDTLLWTVVMFAAWMSVAIVRWWLWADDELYSPIVFSGRATAPGAASAPRGSTVGWSALVVNGLVAVFFIWLTIARTPVASVARGQVIGSVAGGFYLGAMAARYFTGVNRAHWYLLAVPAAALLGYLVGYLNANMSWAVGLWKPYAELATTPPHALARPLPIEYLAVGVTATLIGYWSGEKMEHVVEAGKDA